MVVSYRPVLFNHHVKSRPLTLRGTRKDREPTATYTFFPNSASSTAICVPGLGFRVQGSGPRVQFFEFWVQNLGLPAPRRCACLVMHASQADKHICEHAYMHACVQMRSIHTYPRVPRMCEYARASQYARASPDCPEPTTRTAPSGSSSGFLYAPPCTLCAAHFSSVPAPLTDTVPAPLSLPSTNEDINLARITKLSPLWRKAPGRYCEVNSATRPGSVVRGTLSTP